MSLWPCFNLKVEMACHDHWCLNTEAENPAGLCKCKNGQNLRKLREQLRPYLTVFVGSIKGFKFSTFSSSIRTYLNFDIVVNIFILLLLCIKEQNSRFFYL